MRGVRVRRWMVKGWWGWSKGKMGPVLDGVRSLEILILRKTKATARFFGPRLKIHPRSGI